ncbi:hypothetical protein [Flavobacterium sp. H122]|uniref:hypothetical protein n=1 Tax=Flavobacterium sp. H122 TaxID=2529860 RepID=UPI0010A9F8DD|nr:hypothetical protein [Flavobacterium sp. H122]
MELTELESSKFIELLPNPNQVDEEFMEDGGFNKRFNRVKVIGSVDLQNLEFENPLIFNSCEFDKITIQDVDFSEWIWFKECTFHEEIIIYKGDFNLFHFTNCLFKKGIIIYDAICENFVFENNNLLQPLKIKGGEIEKFVYQSLDDKSQLNVEGMFTFLKEVNIFSNTGANITFESCIINLLSITGNFNSSSKASFSNIKIHHTIIINVNNDGKIYFSNILLKQVLNLNHHFNFQRYLSPDNEEAERLLNFLKKFPDENSLVRIYNNFYLPFGLREFIEYVFSNHIINFYSSNDSFNKPNFEINYSSVGILELKNIVLDNASVKIESSDLSNIKLINTTFKIINSRTSENKFHIFNDLYTSANRQNNVKDKLEYYRESQEALKKYLIEQKEKHWSTQGSLISIKTSHFYSRHGTNWMRAFLITFLAGLTLFIIFIASFENIIFDFTPSGSDFFIYKVLKYFPEYLNPVHKLDFMNETGLKLGIFSGWVDILSRIIIGIGIFEIVRSFRKFVRS